MGLDQKSWVGYVRDRVEKHSIPRREQDLQKVVLRLISSATTLVNDHMVVGLYLPGVPHYFSHFVDVQSEMVISLWYTRGQTSACSRLDMAVSSDFDDVIVSSYDSAFIKAQREKDGKAQRVSPQRGSHWLSPAGICLSKQIKSFDDKRIKLKVI